MGADNDHQSCCNRAAVESLAACKPEDREELCLAVLGRMWGREPVVSFLDEDLKAEAEFWAATASPATLVAYLPAIVDALEDARMGSIVRQWMIRTAMQGLDDATVQSLLKPPPQKQPNQKPRKPMNKAYAAALERRRALYKPKQGQS
jgi:hypothetical protein